MRKYVDMRSFKQQLTPEQAQAIVEEANAKKKLKQQKEKPQMPEGGMVVQQQVIGGSNSDYIPWKKTHFKEQAKITTMYGPGFQHAINKIRGDSLPFSTLPGVDNKRSTQMMSGTFGKGNLFDAAGGQTTENEEAVSNGGMNAEEFFAQATVGEESKYDRSPSENERTLEGRDTAQMMMNMTGQSKAHQKQQQSIGGHDPLGGIDHGSRNLSFANSSATLHAPTGNLGGISGLKLMKGSGSKSKGQRVLSSTKGGGSTEPELSDLKKNQEQQQSHSSLNGPLLPSLKTDQKLEFAPKVNRKL